MQLAGPEINRFRCVFNHMEHMLKL